MNTYVLVHGAWHGAWCWDKLTPLLRAAGHVVVAPDLPGHTPDTTPLAEVTLDAYVRRVCDAVRAQAEPVTAPQMTPVATSAARFGRVPRAYVETLRDNAVTLTIQRQMQQALPCQSVTAMDTSHSPFLSAPELLAAHLFAFSG